MATGHVLSAIATPCSHLDITPPAARVHVRPVPQTIVGVVAHTRLLGREEDVPPEVYMPITMMHKSAYQVVLQVRGEPSDYLQPLRSALREFDPTASAWS